MITGIGVDLCEVSRMEKIIADGRFPARYFSEEEQSYILSRGRMAAESAAGLFAAKEALVKALGSGLSVPAWRDIRVLHDAQGAPYYALRGENALPPGTRLHLSVSHDGGIAAAFCVAERADEEQS